MKCKTCRDTGVISGPGNIKVCCSNPTCNYNRVKTPECDKLTLVKDRSQAIGEFVEWMQTQGIVLASYHEHTADCYAKDDGEGYDYGDQICESSTEALKHDTRNITVLLAEYFEIDLKKVEEEKRAILDSLRSKS